MNRTVYYQPKSSHSSLFTQKDNQESGQSECSCCCCLAFHFFAFRYRNTFRQQIIGREFKKEGRESANMKPLGQIMQVSPWNGSKQHQKSKWNSDMPQIEQLSQQSYHQNSQDSFLIDNPNKESIYVSQPSIIKHKISYQQFQDSHGHKIVKMNNLGDQSENNSSPKEMREQDKQNGRNFDQSIQGEELEENQEEQESKSSHHRHKDDGNQRSVLSSFAERVEQDFMSSPLEQVFDQQELPKNDCTIPKINEQRHLIKQEEKRVKEQYNQSNQHLKSISSSILPPTRPKKQHQYKAESQRQVKRQILQQLKPQHIDPTHSPISNIQQITDPNEVYHPFSQPYHPHKYLTSQSNEQIYSQHQAFQYDHQQLQAQKSRYSRYSQKLDQQLEHQQRKQYTDLQMPKLQKLQYTSQENRHNIEHSLHSEPQSMPAEVKGQMLKEQHSQKIDSQEEQWRLRQQNWLKAKEMENAMDLAFPADLHSDQHYQDHTEEEEIKSEHEGKEQDNFYSKEEEAGASPLVSEGEESDSQLENLPKKLQEDQSAYAIISMQESVKLKMQPFHVAKWEGDRQAALSKEKVNYQGRVEQNVKEEQAGPFYDDSEEESEEQKVKGFSLQKMQNSAVYQREFVQDLLPEPFEQSSSGYYRRERNSVISEHSSAVLPSSKSCQNENYCQSQISESEEEQNISQQKLIQGIKISKREILKQKKQLKAQLEQRSTQIKAEERQQNLDIFHTLQIIIQSPETQPNQQPNLKIHKPTITISTQFSLKEKGKDHPTHNLSHSNNQYPAYHRGMNKKHTQQARTKYVREEDCDPSKYESVEEVIYKRKKPKRRIIEEIYDPIQKRRGSTKKLPRQYAHRHRGNLKTLASPQRSEEQFEQIYVEELVEDEPQIYSYIRPQSYRKGHKPAMKRRNQRYIQTVKLISDSECENNQLKSPLSVRKQ